LGNIGNYCELSWILAWRDVAVRYKQTVIGIARALLSPFLSTVVCTIVFAKLAKLPSEGAAPFHEIEPRLQTVR
jgi:lipopolysaccharide transport system permease protein